MTLETGQPQKSIFTFDVKLFALVKVTLRKTLMRRAKILSLFLLLLGIICFLFGLLSNEILSRFIHWQLMQHLPLLNGSMLVKQWITNDLPTYSRYTFFTLKNLEETLNGSMPVFEERGPYVFRVYFERHSMQWNNNETLLSYESRRVYYFHREQSCGDLSDNVTVFNVPLINFVTYTMNQSSKSYMLWLIRKMINAAIAKFDEKLFVTKTVGELLFEGYEPDFADFPTLTSSKILFEKPLKDRKFGLLKGWNNTAHGNWTVYTGKDDLTKIATVHSYNHETEMSCWNDKSCNSIQGTDGMAFHPFISPNEKLNVFTPLLSRSVYLKFANHSKVRGIKTLKYIFPNEILHAPSRDASSSCFCVYNSTRKDTDICQVDGLLDMSQCSNGLPFVASMPHFYGGSESLRKNIGGMQPSRDKHETFINVDPITGIVIDGASRFQLNIHFRNTFGLKALESYKYGVYPVAWLDQSATIDEQSAAKLRTLVHDRIALFKTISLVILLLGIFLLIVAIVVFVYDSVNNARFKRFKQNKFIGLDNRNGYNICRTENLVNLNYDSAEALLIESKETII